MLPKIEILNLWTNLVDKPHSCPIHHYVAIKVVKIIDMKVSHKLSKSSWNKNGSTVNHLCKWNTRSETVGLREFINLAIVSSIRLCKIEQRVGSSGCYYTFLSKLQSVFPRSKIVFLCACRLVSMERRHFVSNRLDSRLTYEYMQSIRHSL